jgi:hypothetical protein
VAGRHPVALWPACEHPSVDTNGTGWRDVIDVVRTLVVTLSICVRRFVCTNENCPQRIDERFEGIGRGAATERASGFFADLARGRATMAVARDLGVPAHYLRLAVGSRRRRAAVRGAGRLGRHLAIDECAVKRGQVYATVCVADRVPLAYIEYDDDDVVNVAVNGRDDVSRLRHAVAHPDTILVADLTLDELARSLPAAAGGIGPRAEPQAAALTVM